MSKEELQNAAISIVKGEVDRWADATVFITPKIAFTMRTLIETFRKNYWGIFDSPTDPTTGRKKVWIPLTESVVESVVKNIDLDAKDITFYAKHPEAVDLTHVIRSKVKNELDAINFGEKLDLFERSLAINGTAVWKTFDKMHPRLKRNTVDTREVDLLNFYIDPTANSIAETPRVVERAIITPGELAGMSGWMNTEVVGDSDIHPTDPNLSATKGGGGAKLIDIYEAWGLFPKYLLTGKAKDEEEVNLHIVVSGLDSRDGQRVHLIEKFDGNKPYEEAWYQRVPNRWYGRGVAEKLMMLQIWMNTIVNIRINRSYVAQLGLFKIRKGAGITPQMISRLAVNGAIPVTSQDDVEQLIVQEASQASYNDENVIQTWAERVTAAFEVVTGESLPSSTTATIGAITNKNAMSQFVLIREGIGNFLERWVKNQVLPIIAKHCTAGEIVRVTGNPEDVRAYKEAVARRQAKARIESGENIDFNETVDEEMPRVPDYIEITNTSDIAWDDYDVGVNVTNSKIDDGVMIQNLIQAMQVAPEYKDQIIKSLFDFMGVNFRPVQAQQLMATAPAMGQMNQSATDQVTRANSAYASR